MTAPNATRVGWWTFTIVVGLATIALWVVVMFSVINGRTEELTTSRPAPAGPIEMRASWWGSLDTHSDDTVAATVSPYGFLPRDATRWADDAPGGAFVTPDCETALATPCVHSARITVPRDRDVVVSWEDTAAFSFSIDGEYRSLHVREGNLEKLRTADTFAAQEFVADLDWTDLRAHFSQAPERVRVTADGDSLVELRLPIGNGETYDISSDTDPDSVMLRNIVPDSSSERTITVNGSVPELHIIGIEP